MKKHDEKLVNTHPSTSTLIGRDAKGRFTKGLSSRPKLGKFVVCLICSKEFYQKRYKLLEGKGKYCSVDCYRVTRRGKGTASAGAFKPGDPRITGLNNYGWKGDDVGYHGLHHWVNRQLGKAKVCLKCGSKENVVWANKSHKYKRDLQDWLELCQSCHIKYDRKYGWGIATKKFPEIGKIYV